jgi:hypothetical protein
MCLTGAKQQSQKFGKRKVKEVSLFNNTEMESWKQDEVFEGYKKNR